MTLWNYRLLLILLLVLQVGLWGTTRSMRPELGIVPTPPRQEFLQGLALGDKEFLFRAMAFMMQNTGDTYGRFTALKLYNYQDLFHWFAMLDTLDATSDMLPSMASYYFSQTQNKADVRYVVDYLYDHATRNLQKKWWWLVQAIYNANHKLEDKDLALKVAQPLGNKDLPVFAQQMLAIVHENRGEMDQAYELMVNIAKNAPEMEDRELRYMNYFIEERLQKMEEYKKAMDGKFPKPIPTPTEGLKPD